jgi:hypothetical protein
LPVESEGSAAPGGGRERREKRPKPCPERQRTEKSESVTNIPLCEKSAERSFREKKQRKIRDELVIPARFLSNGRENIF